MEFFEFKKKISLVATFGKICRSKNIFKIQMAFISLNLCHLTGLKKNFSTGSILKNNSRNVSIRKFSMNNSQPFLSSNKKTKEILSIFLSFCIFGNPLFAYASLDTKPSSRVVDESKSLTNSSVNYIEKSLSKLKEINGGEVYFVSIRSLPYEKTAQEYAQELFQKWNLGEKDVVVVLANKIAKAGIYFGTEVKTLSETTAKSIGEETYPFNAREEQYGSAAIDVNNRLVSILSNKGDPGPPSVNQTNSNSSNFKSAKKTEEQRSKYIAIIVILLVIAFVVPMVQFFWYVKDE
mmetsp:Transcript_6216/g.15888  ORF Transcript_6216/g.15888 Transcript_6216/m.15888 type:complete len:293 (-) Transcript_6216:632-1510(-)